MDRAEDGPDTTSIKPMSSLRAKFESMGKEQDAVPTTPVGAGPAMLGVNGTTPPSRPTIAEGGRKSADLGARPVVAPARLQRSVSPAHRPQSMASVTPTKPSPPLLKINSPRSPHKTSALDLRSASGSPYVAPLTPDRTGESASKGHARAISRATTPALEARMSAFLQAADLPKAPAAEDIPPPPLPGNKPKSDAKPETATGPPAVNRAAKPKVPVKPPVLAKKSSNLTAPEPQAENAEKTPSPFTTPPSSGQSSPARFPGQNGHQRNVAGSHTSAVNRIRADSDASWVQRIRGDSDASMTERARADSNASSASFVEPSSLPDNWFPRQNGPSAREQEPKPIQRAPTMPARYRDINRGEARSSENLHDHSNRMPARPELQTRSGRMSPPKPRSGRTSPLKQQTLPPKRSVDGLKRAAIKPEADTVHRISAIPAMKINTKSALSQGFSTSTASPASATPTGPPAIPAPRRSVDARRSLDTRRGPPPPPPPAVIHRGQDDQEEVIPPSSSEQGMAFSEYPDGTRANRRAPKFKSRPWQIPTEYDTRLFAVCGEIICTTGYITKVWNFKTGEQLLHMEHRENIKVTSVVFKPSPDIEGEGNRIWIGTNSGDIHEIDVPSEQIVKSRSAAHTRREVIRMFRYASELWTLDDSGELLVWKPGNKGMPNLDSQYNNWRVPKGHTFSIACGKQLWIATGKDIRVFAPGALSDAEFQLTRQPLSQPGTGDVTAGAALDHRQDLMYFGHSDGKVSIYNGRDFSCQAVVNVSVYRIACMAGVGEYLWAGYSTGMAYVYDTSTTPWVVKKDWKAHEKQICSIIADPSAMWKMGRLNVITLGLDNLLRIWDGMLQEDWLEARMQSRDSEFCNFRELTAAVLTWNAGASKPSHLSHTKEDNNFFRDYLTAREAPDIFIFGFQELVDLEDKKVTAKSFFKSKKKEPDEQQHMSHQYRAWRDYLGKCLDDFMPTNTSYTLLHTASMVGLFTCIFVRSSERNRIRNVHASEVKRGMGGHHGNKGAIIVRMVLDDSSICMVNCHLAAGQTQTMHRNNDIAEILESSTLPSYPLNSSETAEHSDVFASGGDGSMVMDHEICILNGDLNYRIDTMGRDSVIKHIQQGNLARLLERDQLLLSRRKNPGFRLRAFQENTIKFAPTYKYNIHTDEYDTSEKRRSPAWCDRILYRGLGKVKMEEYRRWDQIRVSDHRPVSGRLRLRVKTVDPDKREIIWDKCVKEYENVQQRIARAAQLEYLTNTLGLSQKEAVAALQGT
ncbi:hypothetical protein CBER1_05579 [Cercospora berteroae]|uniref:Inositol polyphosphate-related phosphatase domain-containing protein n=1 Tax=Cercospora berteroae TaxID=357750 RepID=A0A2S6BSJ2_9PEZI|nr:hypothetical protein CBER1_05579 [Cercospora berteroae]